MTVAISVLPVVPAQTDDEVVRRACGSEPSWICRRVAEATESEDLAEFVDLLFGSIGRIILVLLVAWLVNRLARRAIARFASRVTLGNSARGQARAKTLAHVLQSVTTGLIWAVASITILSELDVDIGPLIASAGIAGVALGFGAQSLVKDFLSGFFILVEDQYGVGDIIDLGEATGTVEALSLRTTRLRDVRGTVWYVPNGTIQRVANMSQQWARALLDISVAYGTDVDRAAQVIKDTAQQLWTDPEWEGSILEEPEVWGIEQLSQEAIQIRLVVKTRPAEQFRVSRELRRRLLQAFASQGIDVPTGERMMVIRDAPTEDAGTET